MRKKSVVERLERRLREQSDALEAERRRADQLQQTLNSRTQQVQAEPVASEQNENFRLRFQELSGLIDQERLANTNQL